MGDVTRLRGGPNLPGTSDILAMLEEAKRGAVANNCTKAIVILISEKQDGSGDFSKFMDVVGMGNTETIGQLEVAKYDFKKRMDR